MSTNLISPYPGITVNSHRNGATILRLHYAADPMKSEGKKIHVPELGDRSEPNSWLTPWAKHEFDKMTDKALYRQEYEIDGSAKLGTLVYQLNESATLENSFPIPQNWTRYFSLDPHPAVPHAALWLAVDPHGEAWVYREFWPSKVCYRFERGILLGKPGPCPDDERCRIKDFVGAVKYLESAENPENRDDSGGFSEQVYLRVIDYAARAFGMGTQDDEKQENYQVRFEKHMRELGVTKPEFQDAIKNRDSGEENVNEWLKPRDVDNGKDGWIHKSRLHIFKDRCPELVYQLKNNRREQLTPERAERQDPTGKPVQVRKHCSDNLLYICTADPKYRRPMRPEHDTFEPVHEGIAY